MLNVWMGGLENVPLADSDALRESRVPFVGFRTRALVVRSNTVVVGDKLVWIDWQ